MNQVIIYLENDNSVSVVFPALEALQQHGIMAIAVKDVPAGKKFAIVNASDLPKDYPQQAWLVNESNLTDGVGNDSNQFEEF